MKNKINVLGTEYKIIIKNYDEEETFKRRGIAGFCDSYAKEIVICNSETIPGFEFELKETIITYQKCIIRHEITRAFLFESGLAQNSNDTNAWAANEEMVDWIARQGIKIYEAWEEAGAI